MSMTEFTDIDGTVYHYDNEQPFYFGIKDDDQDVRIIINGSEIKKVANVDLHNFRLTPVEPFDDLFSN